MPDATHETWRPIAGYEGLYEVSDLGRVRSLRADRCLKPAATNKYGHQHVILTVDGKRVSRYVHQLVLEAFDGPCPDGMECRHQDGNPRNNRWPENICWGTKAENSQDAVRHGTHPGVRKTHCDSGHEFTPANTYITPSGSRNCRECTRAASRAWKSRQGASA